MDSTSRENNLIGILVLLLFLVPLALFLFIYTEQLYSLFFDGRFIED